MSHYYRITMKMLCERGDTVGPANLRACMDKMHRFGPSSDVCYVTLEMARDMRVITPWEYGWRRLLRFAQTGIWRQRGYSGALSVRLGAGTRKTV